MKTQEGSGPLRRWWAAVGSAIRRAVLGKSCHDYARQFTGTEAYWDRVIAAQMGWPRQQLPEPPAV